MRRFITLFFFMFTLTGAIIAQMSDVQVNRNVRTEQELLQNEMGFAYGIYNQVAQQLQMPKAKMQQIASVYAVVQPATVSLKTDKPNKIMIIIDLLASVGSVG